jgi:hypothetical protein
VFLDDLKAYLTEQDYTDIFRDTMPDQPDECIGLFLWAHQIPSPNLGSGTRYVQIQVRRKDGDDANAVAFEIFSLLDSGADETPIILAEGRQCIARPIKGPRKMTDTDAPKNLTTYYVEISFWGKNDP